MEQFISDTIALFLKPGNGVLAELIYAIIVTILAIVVVQALARLAEKEADLTAKLPFAKRPPE